MKTTLYFTEHINIVSVIGQDVIFYHNDEENKKNMYLVISRKMWKKINKQYLDMKGRYYQMYNEFCGIGWVDLEGEYHEHWTYRGKKTPTYIISDYMVCMEHG